MSAPTGLGPVEVALVDAVDLLARDGEPVRCSDVLAAVEDRAGIGPRYAWLVLVDLGVAWRRHLPLVELYGNCGSALGDPPAEPAYVETRALSRRGIRRHTVTVRCPVVGRGAGTVPTV